MRSVSVRIPYRNSNVNFGLQNRNSVPKKLNIDVDDFRNAQIGMNEVALEDKGKYFCEFGFTKGFDLSRSS